MNLSKKKLAMCICLATLNLGNNYVGATEATETVEQLKSYNLDEIVITATKREENLTDANANISVITKDDIERMHYNTIEEALRTVTGIQFLDYNLPGYNMSKVRINGSDQVVVLIDGVRVSMTGTGQTYPFHLVSDMENIERIEVLKGSASVLYGSDAKGGVINIITKKDTEPKTKITTSTGSFGKEEYKISTEGSLGDTSYRIYGQKAISGKFKDGNDIEWKAHDNSENIGVMLKQDLSDNANIILNYTNGDDDFSFLDHLYNQDIKGEAKSRNLQIIYNQKIDDSLSNVLSYNNAKFEHVGLLHNSRDDSWGNFWNNRYKSTVINDTLTKIFGDTHVVTVGLEHIKSENLNPSTVRTSDYRSYETYQSLKNTSYFLQDEWMFDDKWKLTSGIRYDDPSGGLVELELNTAKSFNLGYNFTDDTNMYIAYNDYFVLPSMYQLYDTNYGNAKLLPEEGKNYEVGINHKIDDSSMINAHYFKRDSDRNIGFDVKEDTYVNDSEKAHGFDIQYEKYFDDSWHGLLSWSRLSYTNKKATTDYGYLPKNMVTVGVDYTKDKWNIGLDGKGFIGRDGNKVESKGWPSDNYWVFNLGLNYKPEDNLKVFAKVNNLFNQEYAEQTNAIWWGSKPGDWYGMPGRNFVVGMEYEF